MVNSHSTEDEEFTLVTSRRKKKRSAPNTIITSKAIVNLDETEVDEETVLERIAAAQIEVSSSEYFASFQAASDQIQSELGAIKNIICFGIGHFSHCAISRYQLAFILSIRNSLNIESITFHEPILTRTEVGILRRLQCQVFIENLEGKVPVEIAEPSRISLVYAPHCPKQLTNNFVWRNWSTAALSQIILVANSFSNIISSAPTRFLETDASHILRIAAHTEERKLKNHFSHTDIFNDTSIHFWPRDKLNTLPQNHWTDAIDEPKYTDTIELITSELIAKLTI